MISLDDWCQSAWRSDSSARRRDALNAPQRRAVTGWVAGELGEAAFDCAEGDAFAGLVGPAGRRRPVTGGGPNPVSIAYHRISPRAPKLSLAETATPQYEETAIISLSRIDDARPEWRTAAVLHGRAMSVIAANCTNPTITTGHRAPATTPTPARTRMGGLSPLLNRSAAAKVPIVVISHPHKYTVITWIAPSCKLEHQSAQSRLVLTLTRLTSAGTPTGNPRRQREEQSDVRAYELLGDCPRVIDQKPPSEGSTTGGTRWKSPHSSA